MKQQSQEPAWQWSSDLNLGVNFCVWVLQGDGLAVPPFDRHPAGTLVLQQAGLTADAWRAWVQNVVNRQDALRETVARGASMEEQSAAALAAYNPTPAWEGAPEVRAELERLWAQYERNEGATWKRESIGVYGQSQLTRRMIGELYYNLKPFQERLRTLRVYPVDYAWSLVYPVPPVSLLIGKTEIRYARLFMTAVLRGAEALAGKRKIETA